MRRFEATKIAAHFFTSTVVSLGSLVLLSSVVSWHSAEPLHYIPILVLANLSAGWNIGLPTFPGTISVSVLFVLLGIANLSLPETVLLGATSLLTQALLRQPSSWRNLTFRVANMSVAIAAAYHVYHATWRGGEASPFWPMVSASVALALLNTFPTATQQALSRGKPIIETWQKCGFWTQPYYLIGAAIAAGLSWIGRVYGWPYMMAALPGIYLAYRWVHKNFEKLHGDGRPETGHTAYHHRTLETLSLAIAARYRSANDHLSRAQSYAMRMADDLRLDSSERDALRTASVLHDIGTLAVPEQIISKAGRLTREEFDRVKIHSVVGAEIIERAEFPYPVAEIVRHHHERWDGQGYPDGLAGQRIPIGARVLAAVDCLVALTTDRPYRRATSFESAMQFITSQSGIAFDPEIVKCVVRHASEFRAQCGERKPADDPAPDFVASISNARRESQQFFALAQEVGRSLNLSETLALFDRRLAGVVPYDSLAVYLLRQGMLVPEYASGSAKSALFRAKIAIEQGTSGAAFRLGKPVLNGNPQLDLGTQSSLRNALAVPLDGADGTYGVLTIYRESEDSFTRGDLGVLLSLRSILASSVENALRFEKAEASATTDALTGLPNARSLFQRLETEVARCSRSGGSFAVIVTDLNGFKQVNDRFGHVAGNEVLRAVAITLQKHCREYDYVARLGGDEFVILLPGLPPAALDVRMRHLALTVADSAELTCPGCEVTLAAGQAHYPDDGTDAETLLAEADSRMYEAKRRRHGPVYGYDFDWTETALR